MHLDGARVFNASVKLDVPVADITQHFDSISFCLSKGLGAPAGSLLCATKEVISSAHRWRKMLGGGMRQSGVLAAAGIISLTEHIKHLEQDHENAHGLAMGLGEVKGIEIDLDDVQTNMVFIHIPNGSVEILVQKLEKDGILISGRGNTIRLVTHFDFKQQDINKVAKAFTQAIDNA